MQSVKQRIYLHSLDAVVPTIGEIKTEALLSGLNVSSQIFICDNKTYLVESVVVKPKMNAKDN